MVIILILLFICNIYLTTGNHKVYNHQHRNSSILDHLLPTLKAATYVAEKSVPPAKPGESIFDVQGNIYDVLDEVRFYAHAASALPNISVICETGFNAGHSAITFLVANPTATYIGFDLGDMGWSATAVEFVKFIFGDRFIYIKGFTKDTLKEANMGGRKCDLLSVDADHHNAYGDIILGRAVSRKDAYVLADDFSSSCPLVPRDWKRAEKENVIRTLDCHKDAHWMVRGEYFKGWCLGQFVG